MNPITAYPLCYPAWVTRTQTPQPSRFKLTLAKARDKLLMEIERFGGESIIISSNAMLRIDGLPYAKQSKIEDTGVAVYFTRNNEPFCIACDKWADIGSNIRSIGLTVESLRGIERYGSSQMVNQAFAGFKALPQNASESTVRQWWEVLEVNENANWNTIRKAYDEKIKIYHPDMPSGNIEKFLRVQSAYEHVHLLKK